jgi:hypothetical protein
VPRESTTKAIVQTRYGSPDVLQLKDVDEPVVKDDEVLVRVHAAAVNIGDWHLMRGVPYVMRLVAGLPGPRPGGRRFKSCLPDFTNHLQTRHILGEGLANLLGGDGPISVQFFSVRLPGSR